MSDSEHPPITAQSPAAAVERPLVSMLLIAYRQQATIAEAIAGALAQTYHPLEILVSDDASDDATWQVMQTTCAGYDGPHRVRLNRNERNLGIGAHVSRLVDLSHGELLFVAAGDDVSLPERCERVVGEWLASDRKLDLLASAVFDVDEAGDERSRIDPSDLASYANAADWLAHPPHVIGAAQAWTRRVFERFGPLPAGVVAEDLLMVFRAICSGGATTIAEPLVRYRRGGISRRRRALHPSDVVERLQANSRHALVELEQLLCDARVAGQLAVVGPALTARLARERFVRDVFAAGDSRARLRAFRTARDVPLALRLRLLTYAGAPWLLAPAFALKRRLARGDRPSAQPPA